MPSESNGFNPIRNLQELHDQRDEVSVGKKLNLLKIKDFTRLTKELHKQNKEVRLGKIDDINNIFLPLVEKIEKITKDLMIKGNKGYASAESISMYYKQQLCFAEQARDFALLTVGNGLHEPDWQGHKWFQDTVEDLAKFLDGLEKGSGSNSNDGSNMDPPSGDHQEESDPSRVSHYLEKLQALNKIQAEVQPTLAILPYSYYQNDLLDGVRQHYGTDNENLSNPSSVKMLETKAKLGETVEDATKAYERVLDAHQHGHELETAGKRFEDAYSDVENFYAFFKEYEKKSKLLHNLEKDLIKSIDSFDLQNEIKGSDCEQVCNHLKIILNKFRSETNLNPTSLIKLENDLTSDDWTSFTQKLRWRFDSNSKEEAYKEGVKKIRDTIQELHTTYLPWQKDWQSPDVGHFLLSSRDKQAIERISQDAEKLLAQDKLDEPDTREKDLSPLFDLLYKYKNNRDPQLYKDIKKFEEEAVKLYEETNKKYIKIIEKIQKKLTYLEQKATFLGRFAPIHTDREPLDEAIKKLNNYLKNPKDQLEKATSYKNTVGMNTASLHKELNQQIDDKHKANVDILEEEQLINFERQMTEYQNKIVTDINSLLKKEKKNYLDKEISVIDSKPEEFTEEEFKKYAYYTQIVAEMVIKTTYDNDSLWWKYSREKVEKQLQVAIRDIKVADTEIQVLNQEIDLLKKLPEKNYFGDLNQEKQKKVKKHIALREDKIKELTTLKAEKEEEITKKERLHDFIKYFEENGKQIFDYEQKRFHKLENELLKIDAIKKEAQKISDQCTMQIKSYTGKISSDILMKCIHISDRAKQVLKDLQKSKPSLIEERAESIKRLRFIYRYYHNEVYLYWIPEQTEKPSQKEIEENIRIFEGTRDSHCVPSTTRSILFQYNKYYSEDDKAKALAKEFASLQLSGAVEGNEIPYILDKKQHPVPYRSITENLSHDIVKEQINKTDQQGKPRPSALGISNKYIGGHEMIACKTTLKEWKDDEGGSHQVEKVLVGDSNFGLLWLPLADITDPNRCGISLYNVIFPDIETYEE